MISLFQSLQKNNRLLRLDTVIHIGAGPYFNQELYNLLGAKRYILVEADPDSAEELRRCAAPNLFTVIERVIAQSPGLHVFRRFSLPSLNSLQGLGDLASVYPRAQEKEQISFNAMQFQELIKSLARTNESSHALLLDIPGSEHEILASLPPNALKVFDWIALSGAGSHLREGAKPLEHSCSLLRNMRFSEVISDKLSNPLYPVVLFEYDRISEEMEGLRRASESLKSERDAAIADRDKQAKLASERQSALEAAVKAKDEQTKLASERQSALDAAVKERDALKKTAGDRAARIAELEAQVADQAERQKLIDEQMIRAETQLEMLKEFLQPAFQ